MVALHNSIEQLALAMKSLRSQWERAKMVWKDNVSYSFEKQYWVPIESSTQSTLKELEQVAAVIRDAQRQVH